jgi:hypothetical protein
LNNDILLRNAVSYECVELLKFLVEQGADIHLNNDILLRNVVSYECVELLKYLVDIGADISANDYEVVKIAASRGSDEMLKIIVDKIKQNKSAKRTAESSPQESENNKKQKV